MSKTKPKSQNMKRLEQLTAFRTILNSNLSIEELEEQCFTLLSNYRSSVKPIESINVLKNFLSISQAEPILRYRYIKNSYEILALKRLSRHNLNTLCDEINWISEILIFFKEDLNEIILLRDNIEAQLLFGYYDKAKEYIEKLEFKYGKSQYSINSHLNYYYFTNDVEGHNAINENFESIECGLSKTILVYDGVKSNLSVSPERYHFALGKMKEEFNFSGINHYDNVINFRHDFNPKYVVDDLYELVKNESEMRLVDLYSFYLKTIGYLYIQSKELDASKNSIKKVSNHINDDRLLNISSRITNKSKLEGKFLIHHKIAKLYYQEDYEQVLDLCEHELDLKPYLSSLYESYAKSLIKCPKRSLKYKDGVLSKIINLLINIYSNSDRFQSIKSLEKIQQVLNHYPWSISLKATIDKYSGNSSLDMNKIYDYSDCFQVVNNIFSPKEVNSNELELDINIPDWRVRKIKAEQYFYNKCYLEAKCEYESLEQTNIGHIDEEVKSKILQCSYLGSDYESVIDMCSFHLKNGVEIRTLPINEIAKYIASESTYTNNNNVLEKRIIILSEYYRNISSDYIQQLSNLMENYLENLGVFTISEIYNDDIKIPNYIFGQVLTCDVMDGMTCYFDSKYAYFKERIKILQYLTSITDDTNSIEYNNEKKSLTRKLIKDVCSSEAGDGKVFVDRESIKLKILNRFELALKTIQENEGEFNSESKQFTFAIKGDVEYVYVDDTIVSKLSELIVLAMEEYTINKLYGIDQSLNVGIRHGGMVNLLWAPLKDNNLAAIKKEGKFFANPNWRIDSGYYKDDIIKIFNEELVKFNVNVNDLIQKSKSKVNINTGEFINDSKLFNYYVDVELIKELASTLDQYTAESFIDKLFDYFDDITNKCLDTARTSFIDSIENEYKECLSKLKETLRNNDVDVDWINRSIASARIELESKIVALKSYFDWIGKTDTSFSMDIAFEKAIDVIKEMNPWADLDVKLDITCTRALKGEHFYSMVSIFTMLIENITKYVDGICSFEVNIHEKNSNVEIEFINERTQNFNKNKVDQISFKINSKYIEGSLKENGSGLYKIKRILNHDMRVINEIIINTDDNFSVMIKIINVESLTYENTYSG